MPKKSQYGYVFFENQHYLRKVSPTGDPTNEFFVYSPVLAARPDMIHYDPFSHDHSRVVQAPGVDQAEQNSNRTKDLTGLSREEIRDAVKDFNRPQKTLWALDLLFQQTETRDITTFHPTRVEIMKVIGPPVTGADLLHALEKFKENPVNIEAMIKEAAVIIPPTPEEEEFLVLTDAVPPPNTVITADKISGIVS